MNDIDIDLNIISLYKVYEIEDINYFSDEQSFYERKFSTLKDIKLGITLDDMIIDIETMQEFNFINDELQIGNTYIDPKEIVNFSQIYNTDKSKLKRQEIIKLFNKIKQDNNINKYIKIIKDNEYYYFDIKRNNNIINYYNDHNDAYYYDEYKEYRKMRILNN